MRLDLTEARVQVSGGRGRRGPARDRERDRDRDREQRSGRPRAPRPRGGRADPRVLELRGPRGVLVVRHGPARLRAGYLAAIKSPIGLHKSPLSARTNRAI